MYSTFYRHQLVYLLFILTPQILSAPAQNLPPAEPCSDSATNCTNDPLHSTTTTRFTTTSSYYRRPRYSMNLKLAAIIVACICLAIGTIRICFVLCNSSRDRRRLSTNRRRSIVHPHVATIEQNPFKPDLPPAYAEAMANNEFNASKLPSYNELSSEQRSRDAIEPAT